MPRRCFEAVAAPAQLKVLISGGFSGAYEHLLPEFERTSGIKVTTGSGASQGTGPQTIAAQLARGVSANVVILGAGRDSEVRREHRHAEGYSRKIHVRSGGDPLRGDQLTEALPGEDHYVGRHAAGELRGNRLRPRSLRCTRSSRDLDATRSLEFR